MLAIRLDRDAVIEQLLPLLTSSWQSEPLNEAAKAGKTEWVKRLIPFCNAESGDALSLAARHGHVDAVKSLLRYANPLDADSRPLYEASLHGHPDVVFQLLLCSDAKVRGSRALIAACKEGHLEVVKHLLPFSSKIQCAQQGLKAAAEQNHEAVVKFLIGAGLPDPEDTYSLGLNIAAAKGHAPLVRILLWAIVRTGFSPRDFGQAALFAAAKNGHVEVVKSVLEFAHKTAYPEAALCAALLGAHEGVADILVRRVRLDHVRELIADEETEARLGNRKGRCREAIQRASRQREEQGERTGVGAGGPS